MHDAQVTDGSLFIPGGHPSPLLEPVHPAPSRPAGAAPPEVVFLLVPQFKIMMTVIWVLFVPFYFLFNLELARRSQRELDKLGASSGQ